MRESVCERERECVCERERERERERIRIPSLFSPRFIQNTIITITNAHAARFTRKNAQPSSGRNPRESK
jgi:hypothetical protein